MGSATLDHGERGRRVVGRCRALLRASGDHFPIWTDGSATVSDDRSAAQLDATASRCSTQSVLRAVLLAGLGLSVVAGSAVLIAEGASRGGHPLPATAASKTPPPAIENPSWSGELAWAAKNRVSSFDHVTGAWVQPRVVASSSAQYADSWVGIDGYDGKLLQTGTTAWTQGGSVSYEAWFVAWTGTPSGMTIIDDPVAAGDHMEVAIDRNPSGTWTVDLNDATAGWTWSKTVTYPATGSTAEWIEEDPSTWSTPSHYQILADYGSTTFTTVRADGTAPATVTTLDIAENGAVLSYPSTYDPAQGSFTVHYGDPTPSGNRLGPTSAASSGGYIAGQTADGTAAAEFARAFPYTKDSCPSTRAAVVATTAEYQDALSSQFLAQSLTTGTLLTPTESLSAVTATTLKKEGIDTVYIVGGPDAVTTAVASAIGTITAYECGGATRSATKGKIVVRRISGETQYGTAEAVAEFVGTAGRKSFAGAYMTTNVTGGTGRYNDTAGRGSGAPSSSEPTAILASGQEFQDAQAASVVSYHTKLPLLLTPATTLSTTAVGAIEKLGVKQVILVGGPDAVTNTLEAALVAKTGVSVLRVAGKDYTDTSRELARFETSGSTAGLGWTPGHKIMVSRGNGFTDGIAGAVLDGPHNTATGAVGTVRPLLLTENPTTVGTYLATFLEVTGHTGMDGTTGKTITILNVLGGTLAVSPAEVAAMETDLSR